METIRCLREMRTLAAAVVLAAWLLAPAPARADFYRYTSPDGSVHYTDNLLEVPEDQRPGVTTYAAPDVYTPTGGAASAGERLGTGDLKERARKREAEEDKAREAGEAKKAEEGKAAGKARYDELVRQRDALQKEYDALDQEGKDLEELGVRIRHNRPIKIHNQKVQAHNEKVRALQKEIDDLEKQIAEFNQKLQEAPCPPGTPGDKPKEAAFPEMPEPPGAPALPALPKPPAPPESMAPPEPPAPKG